MGVGIFSRGGKKRESQRHRRSARAVQNAIHFTGLNPLEQRILLTAAVSFSPVSNTVMGFSPHYVVSGDFNGDGKPDLVIANYSGNAVSVMMNNGNGTFGAKVNYTTGMSSSPVGIAVGDFNNDGKLDMAVADFGNAMVSVFLNNGDGTFAPKVDYTTGSGASGVGVGDFNGDGKLDLAVSNWNDGTVSVLLNNGTGTFAPKVDYNVGVNPTAVMTADFDGNGKTDLAITNWGGNSISVLLNSGNAVFAPKVDYVTGTYVNSVGSVMNTNPNSGVAVDLNGDGRPDLAVPLEQGDGTDPTNDAISVFINNGNGTFAPKVDYLTSGFNPFGITSGDFNGDGKPDLAATNYYNGSISVYTNNGNGTFSTLTNLASNLTGITLGAGGAYYTSAEFLTGTGAFYTTAADFNGDGKADLAVSNWLGGTVSVLQYSGANIDAGVVYTVHVTAGVVNFANNLNLGGRTVNVSVSPGATANFTTSQTIAALTLGAGSSAVLTAGGNKVLILKSLTLSGSTDNWNSKLDLYDNDLIVNYNGSASPFTTFKNQVKYGMTTNEAEGIVSTSAITATNTILALDDNNLISPHFTSFSGITLDGTNHQLLGKYTYYGDANLDGKVTGADYTYVDLNLGKSSSNLQWTQGDFNLDGMISGADYTYIDLNLGKGMVTPLTAPDDTATTGTVSSNAATLAATPPQASTTTVPSDDPSSTSLTFSAVTPNPSPVELILKHLRSRKLRHLQFDVKRH